MVGFTGSRSLSGSFFPLVAGVVAAVGGSGVAVGCANGLDSLVRGACPSARVFRAVSFGGGVPGLVRRSAALAQFVAGAPSPQFVGFVAGACPAGLVPSSSSSRCFAGFGSGTWSTLALAAGLGVPVIVFWCGALPPVLPVGWGSWVVAPGPLGSLGGWSLVPAQSRLF